MVRTILVPVDFSEAADAVVRWAALFAVRFGASLRLLHVAAPDPEFVGYEAGPEHVRHDRASELRTEHRDLQVRADALREQGIDASSLLVQGSTVDKILEESSSLDADLVVMGSRGRGPISGAVLGSVSAGVVRGARCPVVVVPSGAD